jgi:hypothetical protein
MEDEPSVRRVPAPQDAPLPLSKPGLELLRSRRHPPLPRRFCQPRRGMLGKNSRRPRAAIGHVRTRHCRSVHQRRDRLLIHQASSNPTIRSPRKAVMRKTQPFDIDIG